MNPSQPSPGNYLDQIAPQTPKKSLFQFNIRTIIIIAVAAVVLIAAIGWVSGLISASHTQPWEKLSAELASTQTVVTSASSLIKDTDLKSVNSDLQLYVANTTRDLATPLKNLGINSSKLSKQVTTDEATSMSAMNDRLEDARLNAKYDSAYASEMSYKLANILTLLQQLYAASGKASTKDFLKTAYDNLLPIQTTLANFSDSNE